MVTQTELSNDSMVEFMSWFFSRKCKRVYTGVRVNSNDQQDRE